MVGKMGGLFALVLFAGTAQAVNPGEQPVALSDENEAGIFANQLLILATTISEQYVREVPVEELLFAALKGLYSSARQPLPATLEGDLKAAKSTSAQTAIVIRARARLGKVPALEGTRASLAAVRSLSAVLDPHSILVPAGDFERGAEIKLSFGFDFECDTDFIDGRQFGVDTKIPLPAIPFRIKKVHPGGPAQRAGFRPDDVITRIDGKVITSENAAAIYASLLSEAFAADFPVPVFPFNGKFKNHEFLVLRGGRPQPLAIMCSQGDYDAESVFGVQRSEGNDWSYWLDDHAKIAYVRIGAIDRRTPGQLAEALNSMPDMKGLILDLRWCPGGFLNQAAEIAALFLGDERIASVRFRRPERQGPSEFSADTLGLQRVKFKKTPVLALVNGETSGGGELIAAALQDSGRAKVAGQRTLGKGSVQTPIYLPGMEEEFAFKLTAGTFIRPSGKNLQRFSNSKPEEDWGVRPDQGFAIPLTPGLGARLKTWHALYALRPPKSREALDLDDPEADPQRYRALRLVKQMIAGE